VSRFPAPLGKCPLVRSSRQSDAVHFSTALFRDPSTSTQPATQGGRPLISPMPPSNPWPATVRWWGWLRKSIWRLTIRGAGLGVGALLSGFLPRHRKTDPAFQAQLAAGGPPDSPFGAGPRIHEMSWALTHLAFDPAKMRRHLPLTLACP